MTQSMRLTQILVGAIVLITGMLVGWAVFNPDAMPKHDCDYYGDRTIENVPARCLKYFQKGGEKKHE